MHDWRPGAREGTRRLRRTAARLAIPSEAGTSGPAGRSPAARTTRRHATDGRTGKTHAKTADGRANRRRAGWSGCGRASDWSNGTCGCRSGPAPETLPRGPQAWAEWPPATLWQLAAGRRDERLQDGNRRGVAAQRSRSLQGARLERLRRLCRVTGRRSRGHRRPHASSSCRRFLADFSASAAASAAASASASPGNDGELFRPRRPRWSSSGSSFP